MPELTDHELNLRFCFDRQISIEVEKYRKLQDQFLGLAYAIRDICPDSRERSLAFTKIEESMFWVNSSFARQKT